MQNQDFTASILVGQKPEHVFEALLDVRGWWSGLYAESFEGNSKKIGDVFSFVAGGGLHRTTQKLVELVPNQKIAWRVTEAELSFVDQADEWVGTTIRFDLAAQGDQTKITFTHVGLVPELQCYGSCAPAWTQYVVEKRLNLEH